MMHSQRTFLPASLAIAALLLPASSRADEPPATPEASAHGWAPVQFRLDASLRIGWSSNLYHAQERREPEFDTQAAQYERYYRMEGPGDAEARLALDLAWRFKHASRRAIGVRLRSRQHAYQNNEIANHDDFRLDATFDVTPDDRLRVGVDYAPEHFRKNLKHEAFPGITVFERADWRESGFSLRYDRDWSTKWSTSLEVGTGRRDYATPFDGRDEDVDAWSVGVQHELTKRVALELSFARGSTGTPVSVEVGVPKDRSHDDDAVTLGIDLNLRHGWRVHQSSTRIVRDFTTDEPLDTSRYGRTDRRWAIDLDVEKKLADRWSIAFDAAWTNNDSGREAVGVPDSGFDYSDLDVGVTLSFRK